MTDISVTEGDYSYKRAELSAGMDVGLAGVVALVGKHLIEVNKEILALSETNEIYKFHSALAVEHITIYWDGEPTGVVQFLDDVPQFIPFVQREKIQ